LRGTMTDGIISAISRDLEVDGRVMTLLQTNAALNSGNSGGPLINLYGQVIGINTMKIGDRVTSAGVEGLGFAIPSVTVKNIVDQLIGQGYVSGRPWLGISGESLSPFYQHYYLLPAGLYITSVESGSPADLAGILPRDILLALDGTPVTSQDDLERLLLDRQTGDTVVLTLYRAGQQGRVELTLAEDKG
ncbi:MAG: PDZ domain-containing protein, partial [Clostridia bacterium]|nr:PDZ domain-containing protein [Clostridia bacterium]